MAISQRSTQVAPRCRARDTSGYEARAEPQSTTGTSNALAGADDRVRSPYNRPRRRTSHACTRSAFGDPAPAARGVSD